VLCPLTEPYNLCIPMHPKRVFAALLLLTCLQISVAAQSHKHSPAAKTKVTQHKPDLAEKINAILSQPQLAMAHWGIEAVDLATGKAIYSLNQDQLFVPASNMKLFTTAAVLATAGPDYRFHTTVETTGKIDANGKLQGDLVIVGRGDPNISGRVLPYQLKSERIPPHTQVLEEMADQVAHSGLKAVNGDVLGDDTFYAPERLAEGWAQDDLQWVDAAPVSALAFNDDVAFIDILPGAHAGDKASVSSETEGDYYEFDNRIVTTAAGVTRKVGIHREPGSHTVLLWGGIPVGDPGMKEALAVDDPAAYTAQLFRMMLERRGIQVSGSTHALHADMAQFFDQPNPSGTTQNGAGDSAASASTPGFHDGSQHGANPPGPASTAASTSAPAAGHSPAPQVLAEHISLPLIEDVKVINKISQNLHAEMALRLVGKLSGEGASFEGGAAAVKKFLVQAGVKSDEFVSLDGSGLSRRDLVTPSAAVQLLMYASKQPWGPAYENSLPVSGVDGSLSERFVNTAAGGLVHAKTGSLSHVNALSGYGQTLQGKKFAFSIFCNNHNLPAGKVLAAIDSIVQLLVKEGDATAASRP
jgi:serine-type D-Ala-D-Ala carboxypeptidase/endopeptidase (penicillin-binding protein 4)